MPGTLQSSVTRWVRLWISHFYATPLELFVNCFLFAMVFLVAQSLFRYRPCNESGRHELLEELQADKDMVQRSLDEYSKLLEQAEEERLSLLARAELLESSWVKNYDVRESDQGWEDQVVSEFASIAGYYMLEKAQTGLVPKPAMSPFVERAREHQLMLNYAYKTAHALSDDDDLVASSKTMVGAFVRVNRTARIDYTVHFTGKTPYLQHEMRFSRPFRSAKVTTKPEMIRTNLLIHLIMPLAQRLDKLTDFLAMLEELLQNGRKLFFTLVYFGDEGAEDAQELLAATAKRQQFEDYNFIKLALPFSRGRGLQEGAMSWRRSDNVLMFFVDVDVHFDSTFLDRCELLTEGGRTVYYPIVFSQYNPKMVYRNMSVPPPLAKRFVVQRGAGYWRDFGFGMTCLYLSDFNAVGGFDLTIQGWGGEDVLLYRRFLGDRRIRVVRAVDRYIFHIFHSKECSPTLSRDQARMCFGSKGISEASHQGFGHLMFEQ